MADRSQFRLDPSYNDVASRLADLRVKHPDASMQPLDPARPFWFENVIDGDMGVHVFLVYAAACYRTPDDTRPGIGIAWEPFPGRTPYTRDSEVMVAETSAWGRAIVAALAADTKKGIASSDEIAARTGDPARAAEQASPSVKTDPYALAAASPPEKPIAAMTMAELIAYGRQIGVVMSGSKADFVRTLEPYVLAATGEEPWDDPQPEPGHVPPTPPGPRRNSDEIAFEPVVAKPTAERLLPPDVRKSVRSQ